MEQELSVIEGFAVTNLALMVAGFALLVAVFAWLRISALNKKIMDDRDKLEKRLRIITSGAVGMGEKLMMLETRIADVVNGQLQAAEAEAQFSYTQALKLIESGVDHSVVMSNSGLSESEVNLMELLHQSRHGNKLGEAG